MMLSRDRNGADPGESAPLVNRSRFFFDDTLVVIQIENLLFKVHKYQLLKSETFADMFAMAEQTKAKGEPHEGTSNDNPITLEGVSASDFESLLTALYAGRYSDDQSEPDSSLIISAFRLAHKWNFVELRKNLMPLAEKFLSDVDKIVFAQESGLDGWVIPAYTRLCERDEPLDSEEARKIGVDGVLLVARVREVKYTMPMDAAAHPCRSSPGGKPLTFRYCCDDCGRLFKTTPTRSGSISDTVTTWVKSGRVFTNNSK